MLGLEHCSNDVGDKKIEQVEVSLDSFSFKHSFFSSSWESMTGEESRESLFGYPVVLT